MKTSAARTIPLEILHQTPTFNLLDEPWIQVLDKQGELKELSLLEVFEQAHEIHQLAGETDTQNSAVFRFLLAILHTVVSSATAEGKQERLSSPRAACQRWESFWEAETLPYSLIQSYLEEYRESFWLLHPEHPFWQDSLAMKGTKYKVSKLYGDLSESGHKTRLFQSRSGDVKEKCSFAEAARWLLFINGYDDTSSKTKEKGDGSPGAGWLGKISQVYVQGNDLRETLLLNLPLLKCGKDLWPEDLPSWEEKESHPLPRHNLNRAPESFSGLMTLRSRWLYLIEEGGKITEFYLLGGNFFPTTNAFSEQFTLWREIKSKSSVPEFAPKRHDPSRQLWRDFSNFVPVPDASDSMKQRAQLPGIIQWIQKLQDEGILEDRTISLHSVYAAYMDKDFALIDMSGDSLSFHSSLLKDWSEEWREHIYVEIKKCDQLASAAGELYKEIAAACGSSEERSLNGWREKGREAMYIGLDLPFKTWLDSLRPEQDQLDQQIHRWRQTAEKICHQIEHSAMEENKFSPAAIFGRAGSDKTKKKDASKKETAGGKTGPLSGIDSIVTAQMHFYGRVHALLKGDDPV